MPYITKDRRERIIEIEILGLGDNKDVFGDGQIFHSINMEQIDKPGELNYAITEMMINYLNRKGVSYTNMNEVIGVLECAKLELYRRMTAPYEDMKIDENGDVY